MSRLTRRDMKRDEVREGLGQAVDYARTHGRQLLLLVALVVVVAAAIGGWFAYRNHRAEQDNVSLARAIRLYEAEIDPAAPRPDDPEQPIFADDAARAAAAQQAFEEVRRSANSRLAAVAAAYLANLAAESGDLAAAQELWREAGSGRDTALSVEARLNRWAVERAEGRSEQVLAELRTLLAGNSGLLPGVVILDQIAITLEDLDRTEEARDTYQRIVDEFPQSVYANRARNRVAAL